MSGICADPAPAAIAPGEGDPEGDPDAEPDGLALALPVALGVELGLDCARLIGLVPVQAATGTATPIAAPMATATRARRRTSAGNCRGVAASYGTRAPWAAGGQAHADGAVGAHGRTRPWIPRHHGR